MNEDGCGWEGEDYPTLGYGVRDCITVNDHVVGKV